MWVYCHIVRDEMSFYSIKIDSKKILIAKRE